ncbi:MAG: hypothetical protein KDJ69_16760 [Nitratireductor sp.]|nr:hypothetical protein [Nitratireductor sp.]
MAIKGLMAVLREADRGDLLNDLELDLATIVETLEQYGSGKATLRITLEFKAKDGMFFVEGDNSVTLPKKPRSQSLFYADGTTLSRRDPNQREFKLQEAPNPETQPDAAEDEAVAQAGE